MFDLTATGIRSLAIVLLVIGGVFLLLFLPRLRLLASVRRGRRRGWHMRNVRPMPHAWPMWRDGLAVLLCAIAGGLGLVVADSLAGFEPLPTVPTRIGTLRVTTPSDAPPGLVYVEFQPTTSRGEPIGRPIAVQGFGDTAVIGFTRVEASNAFRIHGARLAYKIDFVGTKWADGAPDVIRTARFTTVNGGRVVPLATLPKSEWPFPYDVWTGNAEARTLAHPIADFHAVPEWPVMAAGNGLWLSLSLAEND